MRGSFDIFDEDFERLEQLVEKDSLFACANRCAQLITHSALVNYKDGMMIAETLEGVFVQLGNIFLHHEVPEEEKSKLIHEIKDGIAGIRTSYRDDDKNIIYKTLTNIRSTTTSFQLKCMKTFPLVQK